MRALTRVSKSCGSRVEDGRGQMQGGEMYKGWRLAANWFVSGCALALAGCASDGNGLSVSSLSITTTDQSSFTSIRSERSGRLFAAAPEPSSATDTHASDGFGIIRDQKMETYLGGILQKLMNHWHGTKPERVGIFIVSGNSVRAKATPSGDILIPIGAFDEIENEDQLAVLIAHELGHIILRHHEDEKQAQSLAKIATTAVGIVFAASSIRNGGMRRYGNTREYYIKDPRAVQSDTLKAYGVHQALVTLTQDILLTAYSREQEHAADLFGTRLAGNAGYDPRAILVLIQRWHDAEETERKRQEQLVQQAGVLPGIVKSVGQAALSIIAEHPSAESRRENVVRDMAAAFPNSEPKPPVVAPYQTALATPAIKRKRALWTVLRQVADAVSEGRAADAISLTQRASQMPGANHPESRMLMADAMLLGRAVDSEAAFGLLKTADLSQPATRTFYLRLALEQAKRKHFDEANKTAAIGERYYGRSMLPLKIDIARMAMESARGPEYRNPVPQPLHIAYNDLRARCEATGDEALRQDCADAAMGVSSDAEYQNCGGVISAIASLGGEGGSRCGNGTKASGPEAVRPNTGILPGSLPNIFSVMTGSSR